MRTLEAVVIVCLAVAFSSPCGVAQDTKSPKARAQELLKRFPDADLNGDGELTREEAIAYRQKNQANPDRAAADGKASPQGKGKGKGKGRGKDAASESRTEPSHADVKYGPAERNVLDFYQAPSDRPTPLVVNIHGGGFVGGDKRSGINPALIKQMHDRGISFASIHYRFVNGRDVIFPAPQHDGARALQFLRSKAKEWNLDKTRVALMGGSAGAGISMWLAFHEDLAQPESDDPVARESTRVSVVGTFGGQGTYNPIEIKRLIGGRAWEHPSLFKVYGVTTTQEVLEPTAELRKLYDESSAITHLTKDDPPLFMVYNEADGPLPENAKPGQGIHHPNFGRQLKEKMDELGIENEFVYTPDAPRRNAPAEMLEFFHKHFEAKSPK